MKKIEKQYQNSLVEKNKTIKELRYQLRQKNIQIKNLWKFIKIKDEYLKQKKRAFFGDLQKKPLLNIVN